MSIIKNPLYSIYAEIDKQAKLFLDCFSRLRRVRYDDPQSTLLYSLFTIYRSLLLRNPQSEISNRFSAFHNPKSAISNRFSPIRNRFSAIVNSSLPFPVYHLPCFSAFRNRQSEIRNASPNSRSAISNASHNPQFPLFTLYCSPFIAFSAMLLLLLTVNSSLFTLHC